MSLIEGAPAAVHVGAEDLPFVDIGGGSKLKVIQVKEQEGLWIVENLFMNGYEVPTHRHTGPVWGYTTSGAWKYKEYDYVNRAGFGAVRARRFGAHVAVHRGQHPRVVPHVRLEPEPRRRRQHRERVRRAVAPSPRTTRCAKPRACRDPTS